MSDKPADRRQMRTAGVIVGGTLVMLALSFASVPLYRAFCAATGFGGATQVAKAPSATQGARDLSVRFDANVARDLPWRFEPEAAKVTVRTGETKTVYYRVVNLADHETRGQAAYNVSPEQAGVHFVKIACFCFTEQTLAAHQTAEWPVVFYLDPALEKDPMMRKVDEVTLSYSFFASKGPEAGKAAPAGVPKT